jgi:hypothetical protein
MSDFDLFEEEVDGSYVLDVISDLVSDFLYYDRKEDDTLHVGAIDSLVKNGELTIDEMVDEFRNQLTRGLK